MITYFVHRDGRTVKSDHIDPAWVKAESPVRLWANVEQPTEADGAVLREVFGIHPLAVDDALQQTNFPKVESYDNVLYVVLHGIDFQPERHSFATADIDFFVGRNFLITVNDGNRRSIEEVSDICGRSDGVLREGPVALFHRIVDNMVDHYRPEVDELEERLDDIESQVLEASHNEMTAEILGVKRDISSMRRVVVPQRDIVGRLARREFDLISQEIAYRFRDVYDQLVRLVDETILFQDRVTGILDAHLASVSNRLAQVSKVLAAVAVIFGPLTVMTGLFGMNVPLPTFPGGEHLQFWWIFGGMTIITVLLYVAFRRRGWL
jgi:magnesium transporter